MFSLTAVPPGQPVINNMVFHISGDQPQAATATTKTLVYQISHYQQDTLMSAVVTGILDHRPKSSATASVQTMASVPVTQFSDQSQAFASTSVAYPPPKPATTFSLVTRTRYYQVQATSSTFAGSSAVSLDPFPAFIYAGSLFFSYN
jgi:hypothetical protein